MVKQIGVDAEIYEKRHKSDSEIRKIQNLTVGEIIKVVCHIARSHELTGVFFSMSDEGKEQLAKAILNGGVWRVCLVSSDFGDKSTIVQLVFFSLWWILWSDPQKISLI